MTVPSVPPKSPPSSRAKGTEAESDEVKADAPPKRASRRSSKAPTEAGSTPKGALGRAVEQAKTPSWAAAVQKFPKEREVALQALISDDFAVTHIDPSFVANDDFMREAILKNPYLAMNDVKPAYVSGDFLQKYFSDARRDELLGKFPELKQLVADQRRTLKQVPDLNPANLADRRLLAELISNRLDDGGRDHRPVAAVVYPQDDWNGQFSGASESLGQLTGAYRVKFYTAGTDREVAQRLADAAKDHPASLVVLGAHGEKSLMAFGADDPRNLPADIKAMAEGGWTEAEKKKAGQALERINTDKYLDLGDGELLKGIAPLVARGGHVLLESCSTGEGRERGKNVANFVHKHIPHANVYAPVRPVSNSLPYKLNARGEFVAPGFDYGDNLYFIPAEP